MDAAAPDSLDDVPPKSGRTGTVEPWRDAAGRERFRARIFLADGSRPRIPLSAGISEDKAREAAAHYQEVEDATGAMLAKKRERERAEARERGAVLVVPEEDATAWFLRYLPTVSCGENHRGKLSDQWNKWIRPVIGAKTMRLLTRDDVEDVRDAIDRAVVDGFIRSKTAQNIWSVLTGALGAAYGSRDRSLRVHATPVHFGVLPPRRLDDGRQRPWLYPNEWIKLAKCAAVPIEWRRLYAIALYTGLRPNELRVLIWPDVDVEAQHITVSKAWDEETRTVGPPKTRAGHRQIPIEPTLLPLVRAMRGRDDELVAVLLTRNEDRIAETFRGHLELAGVTRARLTADTRTEESIDFRSLRDSCATWWALAGVPEKRIQRRLGHAGAQTTDRYIKAAESFDVRAIGAPFPKLPTSLVSAKLSMVEGSR